MLRLNEASWDRVIRVLLGVLLIVAGQLWVEGTWRWALTIIGLIPLLTGLVGFCPLYAVLGLSTRRSNTAGDSGLGS